MTPKLQRALRIGTAFAMLAVSFSVVLWMGNGEMGGMPSCPAMEHGSLCPMNVSEHIDAWQRLFAGVLPGVFMVIAAAWVVQAWRRYTQAMLLGEGVFLVKYRLRFRAVFQKLFDDILQALASGIIHPKQYEYSVA